MRKVVIRNWRPPPPAKKRTIRPWPLFINFFHYSVGGGKRGKYSFSVNIWTEISPSIIIWRRIFFLIDFLFLQSKTKTWKATVFWIVTIFQCFFEYTAQCFKHEIFISFFFFFFFNVWIKWFESDSVKVYLNRNFKSFKYFLNFFR